MPFVTLRSDYAGQKGEIQAVLRVTATGDALEKLDAIR